MKKKHEHQQTSDEHESIASQFVSVMQYAIISASRCAISASSPGHDRFSSPGKYAEIGLDIRAAQPGNAALVNKTLAAVIRHTKCLDVMVWTPMVDSDVSLLRKWRIGNLIPRGPCSSPGGGGGTMRRDWCPWKRYRRPVPPALARNHRQADRAPWPAACERPHREEQ